MKHVITIPRALMGAVQDPLVKAGGGAHKYFKREPYFVGGKRRWRYYYDTPADRERYRKEHDAQHAGGADHHLVSEMHQIHKGLAREKIGPTAALDAKGLSERYGVKVEISAAYNKEHRAEWVQRERDGEAPERNPTQRIVKALDMLPEKITKLAGIKGIKLATRDDPALKKRFKPGPVPAVFSNEDGTLVIVGDKGAAGFNTAANGEARFGSSLTASEEAIWAEVGRRAYGRINSYDKKAKEKWDKVHANRDEAKISPSAEDSARQDFSESFAAMMSHPHQMADVSPQHFDFFQSTGITPSIKEKSEEFFNTPRVEQSWWSHAKIKSADVLKEYLNEKNPPSKTSFESPKDKFYAINADGRTLYIRFGPNDQKEEDNWETMPDTIDAETGYPKRSADGDRWKAAENYKEIIDEHGNRLNHEAAFMHLHPDLDQPSPEDYKKTPGTQLFQSVYRNVGRSAKGDGGDGDGSRERAIIAKHTKKETLAKYEEMRAPRWRMIPHEIPHAEFAAKTPAFAFGQLKEVEPIEDRSHKGKPRKHRNPQTGKRENAVQLRIYESSNPDGSRARIVVNESAVFVYGEMVKLPVTRLIEDYETGEKNELTTWEYTELNPREHSQLSVEKMALAAGVSVVELLSRNGKTAQYQLQDPMLTALINPSGLPIRDAATLHGMLKNAADAEATQWVSLEVGSDLPPTNLHAQVKFDGAGSPLLVGDYWKNKLGIANPRVSDLINPQGGLKKVERIIERKAVRPRIEINDTVRVQVDGKWVFGTLIERSTGGGKRSYTTMVHPGQGVDPGEHQSNRVASVPSDIDPNRPTVRMREIRQPRHDVALYADDMSITAKGDIIPGSGIVRIALPSDGSITLEQMGRAPGVRIGEDGSITLALQRIDEFRDHWGGFIMDEHVQMKLTRMAKASRKGGGKRAANWDDIADSEQGNKVRATNPDGSPGLLAGCKEKIGKRDFQLADHQVKALQSIADAGGRQLLAHFMGTGKTVTSLAAIKMMQNLKDANGNPHPNRPKRVLIIAPKNTVEQWELATSTFTDSKATVLGGSSAFKSVWSPPDHLKTRPAGWSEEKWSSELKRIRLEESPPGVWNPDADDTDIVVVSQEYYTIHQEELRRSGGFDGVVVDEAHGIQNENERSKAIEEWNSGMKMMLLLTGTPITNRVDTLPRYLKLLSDGEIDLGTAAEFAEEWLQESAVLAKSGSKSTAKMDINPQLRKKLALILQKWMDVATTADVKGKTIPAVLLDENTPAEMTGMQATLYRLFMDSLTPKDKERLERAQALGQDEKAALKNSKSNDGIKKVNAARNIANTPGYKTPDDSQYMTFKKDDPNAPVPKTRADRRKREAEGAPQIQDTLKLPTMKDLKKRFKGRWPDEESVKKGQMSPEEYAKTAHAISTALNVNYDRIKGQTVASTTTPDQRKRIEERKEMGGGVAFGKRVANPEYGPEGAICRGHMNDDGSVTDLIIKHRDVNGKVIKEVAVPAGYRFVRDPNAKAAGLYYAGGLPEGHPDYDPKQVNDWDYSKDVIDDIEGVETDGEGDGPKNTAKERRERGQTAKKGSEAYNINKHPDRRDERAIFDAVMTHQSAKGDAMGEWIGDALDPMTGGNPDKQLIFFGKNIGSSVRTMESKLRTMGYQDVNEALNSALASDDDHPPATGKYFVTYMGDQATLGDRDLNSNIFRKRKDDAGRDTNMSLFVHRMLNGSSDDSIPDPGVLSQGWTRGNRDEIKKNFKPMEAPAAVMHVDGPGGVEPHYLYEKDMNPKDRAAWRKLEDAGNVGGPEARALFDKYSTTKEPMTDKAIGIMNNCQMMVASDAAQVGLNWGNATDLMMYDSLFSPMDEWQRITRAARMLDPAIARVLQPHFDKLGDKIKAMGQENKFAEFAGNANAAMAIVEAALNKLPATKKALFDAGQTPTVIAESFLAQRTLDRINILREEIGPKLKKEGRTLDTKDPKTGDPLHTYTVDEQGNSVPQRVTPEQITDSDIMNEIVERHLQPFEREVLRSRKYLVNVKRLTTSVENADGEMEIPAKAEKSILLQQKAKARPVMDMFSMVQTTFEDDTNYGFSSTTTSGLAQLGTPVDPLKSQAEVEAQKNAQKARAKANQESRAAGRAKAKQVAAARRAGEAATRKAAPKGPKKPVVQTPKQIKASARMAEAAAVNQKKREARKKKFVGKFYVPGDM
jgi:superfamily II DNA or RNA helicase